MKYVLLLFIMGQPVHIPGQHDPTYNTAQECDVNLLRDEKFLRALKEDGVPAHHPVTGEPVDVSDIFLTCRPE